MTILKDGPVTETRLAYIMDLMRRWKWRRGETGAVVAKEWGISEEYVGDLAAEASKRVRAEVTDPSHVSGTVATALAQVLDEGMSAEGAERFSGRRLVVEAAKAWAQIVGAMAPTRTEITTGAATPAKAAELVREKFGRVTPKVDDGAAPDASAPRDPSDGTS